MQVLLMLSQQQKSTQIGFYSTDEFDCRPAKTGPDFVHVHVQSASF